MFPVDMRLKTLEIEAIFFSLSVRKKLTQRTRLWPDVKHSDEESRKLTMREAVRLSCTLNRPWNNGTRSCLFSREEKNLWFLRDLLSSPPDNLEQKWSTLLSTITAR